MSTAVKSWFRSTGATYFANAVALREYRSQLRGAKAAWLWFGYLLLLILVGGANYISVAREGLRSVAWMQSQLTQYYTVVVELLATAVCLIAPALTAASIVSERQGRSLDLVLTTPIDYRYYLVGKLLSSYRYTWMLLILSLPITATCVVLGGATWMDVLNTYVLLSAAGLVLSSLGLAVSAAAPKIVSAVLWTYAAVGAYLAVISAVAASSLNVMMFRGPTGMASEGPCIAGLSPFMAIYVSPTYTTVWGLHVPNSVMALVISVLISRMILLAPASHLSGYSSPSSKALRANFLVYWAGFLMVVAGAAQLIPRTAGPYGLLLGGIAAWSAVALTVLIPHISTYGKDCDRKYRNDGMFSFAAAWAGSPAGGLPYIISISVAGTLALFLKGWVFAPMPDWTAVTVFLGYSLWGLGYLVLMWSFGRLASSLGLALAATRALTLAILIAVVALPLPFITMSTAVGGSYYMDQSPLWSYYILSPISIDVKGHSQAAFGLVMLAAAIAVCALAWLKEKDARLRQSG